MLTKLDWPFFTECQTLPISKHLIMIIFNQTYCTFLRHSMRNRWNWKINIFKFIQRSVIATRIVDKTSYLQINFVNLFPMNISSLMYVLFIFVVINFLRQFCKIECLKYFKRLLLLLLSFYPYVNKPNFHNKVVHIWLFPQLEQVILRFSLLFFDCQIGCGLMSITFLTFTSNLDQWITKT